MINKKITLSLLVLFIIGFMCISSVSAYDYWYNEPTGTYSNHVVLQNNGDGVGTSLYGNNEYLTGADFQYSNSSTVYGVLECVVFSSTQSPIYAYQSQYQTPIENSSNALTLPNSQLATNSWLNFTFSGSTYLDSNVVYAVYVVVVGGISGGQLQILTHSPSNGTLLSFSGSSDNDSPNCVLITNPLGFQYNGILNGGIFVNANLAVAPTEITLQQNTPYTYTAMIYNSQQLSSNGSYSIGLSVLSTNPNIFSNYGNISQQTYNYTFGTFSFIIPQISNINTVYDVLKVNITSILNGKTITYQAVYNLGFYQIGGSGDTGVPYPTPNNGGGDNNGGGSGTGAIIPILSSIFGNVVTDIVFVIFGIVCGLLTWKFALTGLVAGIGISTFLCAMAGLLPIWAVGLCIVLDVTIIILGSGLLNKTGNEKTVG